MTYARDRAARWNDVTEVSACCCCCWPPTSGRWR